MKCGDIFEYKHSISQKDVECYAKLSTDHNPIHLVDECKNESIDDKIVHGMYIVATITSDLTHCINQSFKVFEESTVFKVPLKMNDPFISILEIVSIEGNDVSVTVKSFNSLKQQLLVYKCKLVVN